MRVRELNEQIQRRNFLSFFALHLEQVRPYLTKEDALTRMRERQCIFTSLLKHFRGDSTFREMRKYFASHKDSTLIKDMLKIINSTLSSTLS